jgi:predicted  nucleic acid-binding Zn ribbon protein
MTDDQIKAGIDKLDLQLRNIETKRSKLQNKCNHNKTYFYRGVVGAISSPPEDYKICCVCGKFL